MKWILTKDPAKFKIGERIRFFEDYGIVTHKGVMDRGNGYVVGHEDSIWCTWAKDNGKELYVDARTDSLYREVSDSSAILEEVKQQVLKEGEGDDDI